MGGEAAVFALDIKVFDFGEMGGPLAQRGLELAFAEGVGAVAGGEQPGQVGQGAFGFAEAAGDVFFGLDRVLHDSPVTAEVKLPGGSWQLLARPSDGWAAALPDPWGFRALIALGGSAASDGARAQTRAAITAGSAPQMVNLPRGTSFAT